jgi:hypothetical protein
MMKEILSLPEVTQRDGTEIENAVRSLSNRIRVAIPGIVQSFDASEQTVTVRPSIRERINTNGQISWINIPDLPDVPIYMPRAGGYTLTMPVNPGDECLVIFADMCIDAWWQSGDVQNQLEKRRHDLSDGFALIGPWSQPRVIPEYSWDTAQLRNDAGDSFVEVMQDKINITTTSKVTVTAPEVVVNAETSCTINSPETTINADKYCTINSPMFGMSGGWNDMRRLIDERFQELFNQHTHEGVQPGGGRSGVPDQFLDLDSYATTAARGK